MKILLAAVNAKYIHSNPAVYSLRAYAGTEYEKNIEIAEYTINHRTEDILSDIYRRQPTVIAFSCYIWNWRMIMELVGEICKILPGVPIWLGGPEVSFDAEQTMRDLPAVTGIMIGEGEQTFLELLKFYLDYFTERDSLASGTESGSASAGKQTQYRLTEASGRKGFDGRGGLGARDGLGAIDGIVFRDGKRIVTTGERKLTDMGRLPFLYEELESFHNRIIYYESARGCPFKCSYCLSSIDKKVRLRDMDTVKRELKFFLDNKVAQVKFIDRTFNCNHEHTMEIWNYIKEHDNGVTNFHFEIAADIMREDEMTLLSQMRPGLVQLEIGVQSANEDTLREINRYTDMDKLKEIVRRIREGHNVHVHLDLIAGLPYEDYDSFGKSFQIVYSMHPEQLQLGFLKVLKGSPMHEKADSYGINYTSLPPYEVLYSKWMSYEEICRLKRIEEMVELYYNSNQFAYTLKVLEKVFESPFEMFEKLADYYEEKGYFVNSPSRVYRYEVLLAFACSYDKEKEELYKELLTFDIYLRENMKSRPAFAADLSEYKETFKNFFEEEERVRMLLPAYGEYQMRQIMRLTHIEVFQHSIWEMIAEEREERTVCEKGWREDGRREDGWAEDVESEEQYKEPVYILFDYKKRDPLTNEAKTMKIKGET